MKMGKKISLFFLIPAVLAALLFSSCSAPAADGPQTTAAPAPSEPATEAVTEPLTEAVTEDPMAWYTASPASFRFTQEKVCRNVLPEKSYPAFFAAAESTGCVLPALPQYFVPQGMDLWEETGWFIVSGYFKPDTYFKSSVLFAVDGGTGEYVGEWELLNADGTPHTGHDGGVAVTERNIYLSTGYTLYRISLEDLKATGGSGELRFAEAITVPTKASFCNAAQGYVFVGDFSLNGNASYTIKGHEHGSYYAWCAAYRIDDTTERGISAEPELVFSIPESIQGFSMLEDGRLFMTKSYGRTNDSAFYITEKAPLEGTPACNVQINGKDVPLYEIGKFSQTVTLPMAEGCTCSGSRAYVIYESGAYYYRDYSSSKSRNPTDEIWCFEVN